PRRSTSTFATIPTRRATKSERGVSARSAWPASPPRSRRRPITPPACACASCRSRSKSCCEVEDTHSNPLHARPRVQINLDIMNAGELLTRWTVRGAVSLYLLALVVRYCAAVRPAWLRTARWLWTAGYVALVIHVFCAFQFFHHWSHAAAYAATARQTEQVVGLNWGGGLYVNYAFMAVWGA